MKAVGISFDIEPGAVKVINSDDPSGRAWFVVNDCRIQYRGTTGYLLKTPLGEGQHFSQVKEVVEAMKKRIS